MKKHGLSHLLFAVSGLLATGFALAQVPAYDCRKANGEIEKQICADSELGALDWTLSVVYAAALRKARNEHPPILKSEQRGWIKERNACWKASKQQQCVAQAYRLRIAELQTRYRLVPVSASTTFICEGDSRGLLRLL